MSTIMKSLVESFVGGVFGSNSAVPWAGPETEQENFNGTTQISVPSDGSETYIVGGGMLTCTTPNSEANAKSLANRVLTYRNMQYYPEVDEAIDHVVNDIITNESDESPISVDLDRLELPDTLKDKIREAHDRICSMLDLEDNAYEVMRQFYVDGRRAYQIILHPQEKGKKNKKGIKKLVTLDPACIRPVTLVEIERTGDVEYVKNERKSYLYDSTIARQQGTNSYVMSINQHRVLEIPFDSVAYADSGKFTPDGTSVVGFLEPAVKPANNLRTIEDGSVIYAITRAIDKRAFYLDTGDLPKKSAEEYMTKMMNKFKTALNYNPSTGDIDNNKVQISMVQDLWMPRKDGVNATEIQTLEGGNNIGETNHLQYFKDKLYKSLKIPNSRQSSDALVNFGGSELAQVTRDEWKFSRHTSRIKKRFNAILKHCLSIELISTNVTTLEEWEEISDKIGYNYAADSYIAEQQENELLQSRLQLLQTVEPYVGKIWSIETVKKTVLKMTDEEIQRELELIKKEESGGLYKEYGVSPLQMKSLEDNPEMLDQFPPKDSSTPNAGDLDFPATSEDIEQ